MVTAFDVGVFVFFFPGAVWFGYRSVRSGLLFRSLAGAAETSATAPVDGRTAPVDGEPAAVRGEVATVEPPDASDSVFDDDPSAVAAFVWRAQFPKSGKAAVDIGDREVSQAKATFASGMESGEYVVDDGDQSFRIDPEWLVETHEATALSALTVGGISRSRTFHTYLWDSPYLHLSGDGTEVSLRRLIGTVEKHNSGVDLDDYYLGSKAIRDGDTLAVRGEVRVEGGEPVLRGTDRTPLTVSDEGFDGLADDLRTRTVKYGLSSLVLLAIAGQFVLADVAATLL